MAIEIKQLKKGILQLSIQDEMTIYTVGEQKQRLFDSLKTAKEMQVDLGGVTEIDSAGVQLLMFLKQESLGRHIKFSLIHHSQAVVGVLELLNLCKHFGDPIVISADWKTS
ncbi:MAG: STAS domain-containing protein [Methylobacter sp.]